MRGSIVSPTTMSFVDGDGNSRSANKVPDNATNKDPDIADHISMIQTTTNLTNDSSSPQTQVDAQILNSGKISPATSISNPPQQLFCSSRYCPKTPSSTRSTD